MTTYIRARQPLEDLSMSNQPERRYSKRLAGTLQPVAGEADDEGAGMIWMATTEWKRSARVERDASGRRANSPPGAAADAAVYDEQDGDFLFTRGTKRARTSLASTSEPSPAPAPAPVRRAAGRPKAAAGGRKRAPSPPRQQPIHEEETPPPAPAVRKPTRRKQAVASPVPEEPEPPQLVIPKTRGTRQAAAAAAPPKAATKATTRTTKTATAVPVANGRRTRSSMDMEDDGIDPVTAAPPPKPSRGRPAKKRAAPEPVQQRQLEPVATPRAQMDAAGPDNPDDDPDGGGGSSVDGGRKIALPFSDTPIMDRNKELRKKGAASGRRSSLGMRGRRASSLIENGHSAIPHREVDPADFYKHIAEGLMEPRRMKQLLTWCGERALLERPPHGSVNSNEILGARAIQDQLLKDFGNKSEFSDWFNREDQPTVPEVKRPVVVKPNPVNIENEKKIYDLEASIKQLKQERKKWLALEKPPPEFPSLFEGEDPTKAPLPDESMLDPEEARMLQSLTDPAFAFSTFRGKTQSRLRSLQSSLEFDIDQLVDGVHKLGQRVEVAGRQADRVLALSADRLKERDEREKAAAGTRNLPVMEVLRSLSRILPEDEG
ncbi:hypothetical protein RB601_009768 [Gaeumannomyces tritici]